MNTIKTMMAVAALALATGNVKAQDFKQRFETGLADNAKLEWDFKQLTESKWPGSTVWVSPWHLSIMLIGDAYASPAIALRARARFWALEGLLTFKDSVYFETSISDSNGKYEAHVDRRDFAGPMAIADEMQKISDGIAKRRR